MQTGQVVQINVSGGAVPKTPVERAQVGSLGLAGDDHNDKKNHGGPDRALCLFSMELIDDLRAEGHPIAPGTVGENLTISGIDWATVMPGKRYAAGEVEFEITSYTTPCTNIEDSFRDGRFVRISPKLNPTQSRVYARVTKEGVIATGDEVRELAL
ncbi:MAG: MOSC domain-containing protein [Dehalococcoidia bacterium]